MNLWHLMWLMNVFSDPFRKDQNLLSPVNCWYLLLNQVRRESKDHATLSDIYLNNVIMRFMQISEDSTRLLKKVRSWNALAGGGDSTYTYRKYVKHNEKILVRILNTIADSNKFAQEAMGNVQDNRVQEGKWFIWAKIKHCYVLRCCSPWDFVYLQKHISVSSNVEYHNTNSLSLLSATHYNKDLLLSPILYIVVIFLRLLKSPFDCYSLLHSCFFFLVTFYCTDVSPLL